MIIKRIIALCLLLTCLSFSFQAYAIDSIFASNGLSGLAEKLGIGGGSNEPLHPDEAFKLSLSTESAKGAEGEKINAIWTVTPGHYIYREKTSFSIKTPESASLGTPEFPHSKTKQDDYLGDTEVYEHDFSVLVPIKSQSEEVVVEVSYQGCSEITGICYPPQKKTHTVKLASLSSSITNSDSDAMSDSITPNENTAQEDQAVGSIMSIGGANEPLHPDEAFKLSLSAEGNTLKAHWKITPEHYLYRGKTFFKVELPADATLGKAVFPKGKATHDEFLGDVEVYEQDFSVMIPVTSESDEITVQTTYQGCSESTGICYPPVRKVHTVKLASATSTLSQALPEDVTIKADTLASAEPVSEQDAIMDRIRSSSSLGTILMFLLFGLGLALTPCVFPMIPILSGIIAGQGDNITTKKAFGLSLAYVIPMALIYALVGVIAGIFGANVQVMFQNPWVISAFALVFVLLSLSMFGFYELQMPSSIQSKLTSISNNQSSGSYIGAGIMGVLSALIVGPCVTAPLIAALSYIAQTGDAVLGGLSLFALGMGMGIPLIIIGTSAGSLLPKAGAWMDAIKAVFGVSMLALAIWMLSRVVPAEVTLALSAVLLIISGIYLKAISPLPEGHSKWAYLWKGVGFILLFYGALMLIGFAGGGKNLLKPLSGGGFSTTNSSAAIEQGLAFKRVRSIAELDQVLATAKTSNQAVMLDFYADWCVSCKEMEHLTFKDPSVINTLKHVILVQADVTANNDDDKALLKKFGLFGPPGILFFSPEGIENKAYRKVGFVKAKVFDADAKAFLKSIGL